MPKADSLVAKHPRHQLADAAGQVRRLWFGNCRALPRSRGARGHPVLLCFHSLWRALGESRRLGADGEILSVWIFLALLVSGTFIDIEHFILPHEITIGGTVVGWLCAFWAPELMGAATHSQGLFISFISSMLGLGILWLIVELGKLAFGRVKHEFTEAEAWSVTQPNDEEPPVLNLQGEAYPWADLFSRKSDRIIMKCGGVKANDQTWSNVVAEVKMETLTIKGAAAGGKDEVLNLESVTLLEGTTTSVVIPREAMGFGDVLFIAMIGAFCSWQGVLLLFWPPPSSVPSLPSSPDSSASRNGALRFLFGPTSCGGAAIWIFWEPRSWD